MIYEKKKKSLGHKALFVFLILGFILGNLFLVTDLFFNRFHLDANQMTARALLFNTGLVAMTILGRSVMHKHKSKWILPSMVLVIVICVMVYKGFVGYLSVFSPMKWHHFEASRYLMYGDLAEKQILDGMEASDVALLLGTCDVSEDNDQARVYYQYLIRDESFLIAIDRDYLVITIEDGLVKAYGIRHVNK